MTVRKNIIWRAGCIVKDCFMNNVMKHFITLKPAALHINVTLLCNSRCATCNIWQNTHQHELTVKDWKRIFQDLVFSRVEYVMFSGGEPTLRKDLLDIVRGCCDVLPRLRKIVLTTNGLNTERIKSLLPAIVDMCNARSVDLSVNISLDGIDEAHDRVRGIPGHFAKTQETISYCQELQQEKTFRLNIGTTISAHNVDNLDEIVAFSKELGLKSVFGMAWASATYYNNAESKQDMSVPAEKKNKVAGFLKERIAESPLLHGQAYYYRKVIAMLQGKPRSFPCPFADQGMVIDALGDTYYCTNSKRLGNISEGETLGTIYNDHKNLIYRRALQKQGCPHCSSSCLIGIALEKQVLAYIGYLITECVRRLFVFMIRKKPDEKDIS